MSAPKRYRACKTFSSQLLNMLCQNESARPLTTSTCSSSPNLDPNLSSDISSSCEEFNSLVQSPNELNYSESDIFQTSDDKFICDLASWIVESNISNDLGNKLLKLLSQKINGLPKDVRTLKKTPKDAPTVSLGDGDYIHYGLKDCLTDFLQEKRFTTNELDLNVNIDGLQVSKSSKKHAWPILINVNSTDAVLVVGIYTGGTHPKDANEYLTPFVDELNNLIDNGLEFESNFFTVKCRSFICDAPARSFILGTKGHSGYSSCTKCTQKGERVERRIIFTFNPHPLRTDATFRNRNDPDHHNIDYTILEKLPIDMINQVPLDYMHVVCLGVVKSLMLSWIKIKNMNFSLSKAKISLLNSKLTYLKAQIPREFARKTRELDELHRFKATEFRLFLLYVGPVVLKDILDEARYNHFLKLSVAIRILLDPNNCQRNNSCASQLLNDFVAEIPHLYTKTLLTFNFHCLTHLSADSLIFGSLETINAFKFENYLGSLKKLIKKKHQIAPQLYNRLVEKSLCPKNKEIVHERIGRFLNGSYTFIKKDDIYFSINSPDNYYCYMNEIFKIMAIVKDNENDVMVKGHKIKDLNDLFINPMKSSLFNIFNTNNIYFANDLTSHSLNTIEKVVHFHNLEKNCHSFVPLVHNVKQ